MKVKCPMCEGTGKYWLSPGDDCKNCEGTGQIAIPDPTQEASEFWIEAEGRATQVSRNPGKWLLFVNKSEVNKVWETIREETLEERLGSSSKVSTKRGWLNQGMPQDYVICVHTPDYKDKDDVDRVRNRLRELGFTQKLGYKTDRATEIGSDQLVYKE